MCRAGQKCRDKRVGWGKCGGTKVQGGADAQGQKSRAGQVCRDKSVQEPRRHGTAGQKCRYKNIGQKCKAGKKIWAGQQCGPKPEYRVGRMFREN